SFSAGCSSGSTPARLADDGGSSVDAPAHPAPDASSSGGSSGGGSGSSGGRGGNGGGPADASTDRDQVAPPPAASWGEVTHELAGMESECGNLSFLSAHPAIDMLIAGVAKKGLWASTDGAASWHAIGTGAGSASITNRTSGIVYDPANKDAFWESGIYNA